MRLFQGYHVQDISANFGNAPGGTRTNTTIPYVGRSLVLPVPLENHLLVSFSYSRST
ncbi:uncharacterized protein E5676_scaffold500G00200 [Cucumis melo var. makuwa]|uniref:Uncharacterized protein n=1 Tax=Cucumis melo var. makuwa TaxID=1194695 RepID=A0A5A7STS4_CUCMM|nr:uncharacterized protein E6C27_scaffold184G00200 [Cucumis melo var. makuwa]TYK23516.1 uncharacterized protein E5676_scaffold500G00200 [Cucumis melo var. makuwa]